MGITMKKTFKKFIATVLTAAMALSFSMPAFAAVGETEQTNNVNEEFCIAETTTLGDIVRNTEPEKYAQMPDEMKEKFNATNALEYFETTENSNNDMARIPVLPNLEVILGSLTLTTGDVTSDSFTYSSTASMSDECPYIFLEVIIYDYYTGAVIDSDSTSEFDALLANVNGYISGLKSSHIYKVVAFGDVIYPEGFSGDALGSKTKHVYTK